jgi:hypothetical protein
LSLVALQSSDAKQEFKRGEGYRCAKAPVNSLRLCLRKTPGDHAGFLRHQNVIGIMNSAIKI